MPAVEVEDKRNGPVFIHSELDDLGLDPYAFRIYARLARRAGGARGAFESVAEMAAGCRMSERRARQSLRELEDAKLVVRHERKGETSVYHLTDAKRWRTPAPHAAPTPAPGAAPDPGTTCRPPRHDMPGTPAPHAAEGTPTKEIPLRSSPPNPPTPPARQPDPGPEEVEEEIRTRTPPRNGNQIQGLMQRHPTTWEALCRVKNDREWKRAQFQAIAGRVYRLAELHGERECTAALTDLLVAGDQVRHPLRWLEAALADDPPSTKAAGGKSEPRSTLLEELRAARSTP